MVLGMALGVGCLLLCVSPARPAGRPRRQQRAHHEANAASNGKGNETRGGTEPFIKERKLNCSHDDDLAPACKRVRPGGGIVTAFGTDGKRESALHAERWTRRPAKK